MLLGVESREMMIRACWTVFLLLCGTSAAWAADDSLIVRPHHELGHITIWMIDAPQTNTHPYLTLGEALRTHRAVIHENNSQRLWIENRSDTDLFLQSGDLIKGGQQDRMVASDMIVPAHDTSHDLNVYCIEHGRSTKRGAEPIETFSTSDWMAPLAHTRLVARHALTEQLLTPHVGGLTAPDATQLKLFQSLGDMPQPFGVADAAQESIWNDVQNVQAGLTASLKDSVTRNVSPSSLELALEHPALANREREYEDRLGDIAKEDTKSVGFAYAIDGIIAGAEQYGSHALFEALWPKLLRRITAEAITDEKNINEGVKDILTVDAVQNFLFAPRSGKTAREVINERTIVEASHSDVATMFSTLDQKYSNANLHNSWIAK